MNTASWIILAVLLVVVAAIVVKVVRDRRAGKNSCEYCADSANCPVHAAGESCRQPVAKKK